MATKPMRSWILGAAGLLSSVLALSQAERAFTLDDLTRMRGVSDPQISPDGERVAYVVERPDLEEDEVDSDIWMTGWDGKETVRLTTSQDSESMPRWSPDGRFLAFLSDRGDKSEATQLWLLPLGGGEAEKLTDSRGSVEDFDWSPDGKRLVLVVEDPDPDAAPDKVTASGRKKAKRPIVIDRFQFKLDEHGYLGTQRSHLVLLDRETRKTEPLTTGEYDELMPAWSPDGKGIAFSSKRGADPDRTDNWDLYVIEPRAGAVPRAADDLRGSRQCSGLGKSPGLEPRQPVRSPMSRAGPTSSSTTGCTSSPSCPAAGGAARVLTAELDRNVASPAVRGRRRRDPVHRSKTTRPSTSRACPPRAARSSAS